MSDVVDILGTSGPLTLDELAIRSEEKPTDLAATLQDLKKTGLVEITGPSAGILSSMGEREITTDSETVVRLKRRAFSAGGF